LGVRSWGHLPEEPSNHAADPCRNKKTSQDLAYECNH
jgi:hypothetical protein